MSPEFEQHYNFEKSQDIPEWLAQNPGLLKTEGLRIPEILDAEGKIEYAHLMLKPEALQVLQEEQNTDVQRDIVRLVKSTGMFATNWIYMQLDHEDLQTLYQKEIATKGYISEKRVDSLLNYPSGHLFLIGPHSRFISTVVKGRVSCKGLATCFETVIPDSELIIPNIDRNCPTQDITEKRWGQGCGVRLQLINAGFIKPDPAIGYDTQWNMIHSSNPRDTYVPGFVQKINKMPGSRFYEDLNRLPEIKIDTNE